MYFSFAFIDAERTRGIPCDENIVDEIQDLNYDFLQIIHETLSGSPYGFIQYAGTPKSLENTIQKLWTDSSQAEWAVKCQTAACNHWNIPSLSHDLIDMIGPVHRGIGPECPGVVCAKCRKPVNPQRFGRWIHFYKERRWSHAGYHIPQTVMPMHYGVYKKWEILVGKMEGKGNTASNVFFNEVCGESYDLGARLVTETDLKNASILPWDNTAVEAEKHLDQYMYRILAVDWGGGGGRLSNSNAKKSGEQRERVSFTVLTVLGMRPDGKIDVVWAYKSLRTHEHVFEAKLVLAALQRFRCSHLAHDYNGAGSLRETLVIQSGFPASQVIAVAYHPSAKKNFMVYHPATDDHPRDWYGVDKSRSLQITCEMIKCGLLRFFRYDHVDANTPGLINDFLALLEEKVSTRFVGDTYTITRNPNLSDDFAQACNIGVASLCYLSGNWPNLSTIHSMLITPDMLAYLSPAKMPDWGDLYD
jgi:hypothetical protein